MVVRLEDLPFTGYQVGTTGVCVYRVTRGLIADWQHGGYRAPAV